MNPKNYHFIRLFSWTLAIIFFLFLFGTFYIANSLSDNLRIIEGESYYVNHRFPFMYVRGSNDTVIILNGKPAPAEVSRLTFPLHLEAISMGEVDLEFMLFGFIPLRNVTVNVLPEIYAVPGGHSIGIKMQSEGVIVAEYYYFTSQGRNRSPSREAGIYIGDIILQVEGKKVKSISHASELLASSARKGNISLTIKRDGLIKEMIVTPLFSEEDQDYRIGLYIRDTAAGVGTLSFYHPETHRFGALGHVIMDGSSQKPIEISQGEIVKANIVNVKAARKGSPGEKTGIFIEEDLPMGTIDRNCTFGIFGYIKHIYDIETPYPDPLPIALSANVKPGPAQMLTVLEGETIRSFDLEIEKVSPQRSPSDKSLIIRVTDEELLEVTGGIVQGMSGSPIIQKGKLVGVITHVFVNDPRRGYGIFMEWMINEAGTFMP